MNIEVLQREAKIKTQPAKADAWWHGAVIYQIYPRSFFDSNGDGIGDLPGITAHLDHIAELGVDAIWISPFFRSPMKDFGYDVSDYCDVDPMFGTLDDFDKLTARAHQLGLRVVVDQVWSHTADDHPWFADSRTSRTSEKADWYVWADPSPDGSPPNNWLSVFGGVAWTWEPRRRQYYLHHFLSSQPQLNLYNPDVERALFEIGKFWIDRGVDGFRLDAVDFMFHDRRLRNNPARLPSGVPPLRPFGMQRHMFDMMQRDMFPFMTRLNKFLQATPHVMTLAEISSEPGAYKRCADYTDRKSQRFSMAYSLALMKEALTADRLTKVLTEMHDAIEHGCVCWAFSNHDVVRAVTRWGHPEHHHRIAVALIGLLITLPGAACLYQGEELGLTEAKVSHADMRDPYGITFYPAFLGRDGARTPMPWQSDARFAGFTASQMPWLPVPPEHAAQAVDVQRADPASLFHAHRRLLEWRQKIPPLRDGGFRLLNLPEPLFGFERYVKNKNGETLIAVFNLHDTSTALARDLLPAQAQIVELTDFPTETTSDSYVLPPYGPIFARLNANRA